MNRIGFCSVAQRKSRRAHNPEVVGSKPTGASIL